jgi:hypothetical protein
MICVIGVDIDCSWFLRIYFSSDIQRWFQIILIMPKGTAICSIGRTMEHAAAIMSQTYCSYSHVFYLGYFVALHVKKKEKTGNDELI